MLKMIGGIVENSLVARATQPEFGHSWLIVVYKQWKLKLRRAKQKMCGICLCHVAQVYSE